MKDLPLTENQRKLIALLFETGAIKFGDFKLKMHQDFPDAPLSPIYLDLRNLQRFTHASGAAIYCYRDLLKDATYDILAGIPIASIGFAAALAFEIERPMVTPRIDAKDHGSGATVDGKLITDSGKIVALMDDLITKGGSKIEAITVLRNAGYIVNDVFVLVDREQGGEDELSLMGITLHSVVTMTQILLYLVAINVIMEEERVEIIEKLDQLTNWPKTHKKPSPPQNQIIETGLDG